MGTDVRVVTNAGGAFELIAVGVFKPGAHILRINGRITRHPSRFTLQVGPTDHMDADEACSDDELRVRFPWRYMNHHCLPNTMIRGMDIYATRRIESGSPITFDYDTTESIVIEPFTCNCGSPSCRGLIRGFVNLSATQRATLVPILAPHLIALLNPNEVVLGSQ